MPVDVENEPDFAVEHERVGSVVYESAEAGFALAERLFGPLALGQIKHEANSPVSFLVQRRDADQDWNPATVLSEILLFKRLHGPGRVHLSHRLCVALAPFWRR